MLLPGKNVVEVNQNCGQERQIYLCGPFPTQMSNIISNIQK